MTNLWELPGAVQNDIIAINLGKYGSVIESHITPNSRIFIFDQGENVRPRYIAAKCIQLDAKMSRKKQLESLQRVLAEANNAHRVFGHELIQNFFHIQIILGLPILLSRLRDHTLADLIKLGPLSEVGSLSIAIQIIHGLNYCEAKGILCHQDLKPANIFLTEIASHYEVPRSHSLKYQVHIADFELANAYLILRLPSGSRPYMPPEQYQRLSYENPPPDFSRVDVFALGVILFEMLTGGEHPIGEHTSSIWPEPTEGKSTKWNRKQTWQKWANNASRNLLDDRSQIPRDLFEVIKSCLSVKPYDRPSKLALEKTLLKCLASRNTDAHFVLSETIKQFDEWATINESDGWPHYQELLESLNKHFDGF